MRRKPVVVGLPRGYVPLSQREAEFHRSQVAYHRSQAEKHAGRPEEAQAHEAHLMAEAAHERAATDPKERPLAMRLSGIADQASWAAKKGSS